MYKWRPVLIYALVHFFVDFASAFLMFRYLSKTDKWYLIIFIYNFFAFAMQMPLGMIADRIKKNTIIAALGCILIALSFICYSSPILTSLIVGTGNGLFHIGSGIDVLNISNKKSSMLGVFISPGAFGIYIGTILGKQNVFESMICVLFLLISVILIFFIHNFQNKFHLNNKSSSIITFEKISFTLLLSIICLFFVVVLRSYVGLSQNFSWKKDSFLALMLVFSTVLGKMSGGFIADKLGIIRASALSLILSSVLFLFSDYPLAGIFAVFLFNMTMPMTLTILSLIFNNAKGLSFGLLTFALFIGFLPSYLGAFQIITNNIAFSLSALLSFFLLTVGFKKAVY